jgi:hypothetical protein
MAVSRGIKLVADTIYIATTAQQLLAAKLMAGAADKQLMAAGISKDGVLKSAFSSIGTKALGVGGAAGIAGTAATVVAVLGSIAGGIAIGAFINDAIGKTEIGKKLGWGTTTGQFATVGAQGLAKSVFEPLGVKMGLSPEEAERKTLVFTALIAKLTGAVDESSPVWQRAAAAVKKTNDSLAQLAGHQNEKEIVNAFGRMQQESIAATQRYEEERQRVIISAQQALVEAARDYTRSLQAIEARHTARIVQIAKANRLANEQAEEQYFTARREAVDDAGEELIRREEDFQENLRKLRRQYDKTILRAAQERDALALVEAQEAYGEERSEQERAHQLEVQRFKQDVAERLQEMSLQYQQERERRQENFEQQMHDARAQRDAERKEVILQHQERLNQIRQAAQQELAALDQKHQDEQQRIQDAFIAFVRDLDQFLLGEENLYQQHYDKMLSQAEAFLKAYRDKHGGSTGTTSGSVVKKQVGGYALPGLFQVEQGEREFILNSQATKAAEKMMDGNLTQQAILARMSQGSQKALEININMSEGMTLMQVRRLVNTSKQEIVREVATALGSF